MQLLAEQFVANDTPEPCEVAQPQHRRRSTDREPLVTLVRRPGASLSDLLAAADALELAAMQYADAERRGDPGHVEATRAVLLKARAEHSALAAQLVEPPVGFAETVMEAVGCLQRNSATRLARRLQAYLR